MLLFPTGYCLRLDRHPVDTPVVDDHDALAEREEACELRLALDEREVLVAAELDRRLGQLRVRLELGVRPHAVAQVEGLVADLAHGQGGRALVRAQRVLLRAVALALADGQLAGLRLRGLLRRRGGGRIVDGHGLIRAADAAADAAGRGALRRAVAAAGHGAGRGNAEDLVGVAPRAEAQAAFLGVFEREVGGVGRDDAVARAEVDDLVGQLLLLAVRAYLLHQPADAPRRPQARQELVAFGAER